MVDFAGYEMTLRYEAGPVAEHGWCRTSAALFDVSHMGVVQLSGAGVAEALEALVPAAVTTLPPGRMRYTMFTNDAGGVIDDVMVTRDGDDRLTVVVNAAGKDADLVHLRAGLPDRIAVTHRDDLALVALQGPAAASVLARLDPATAALGFLDTGRARLGGIEVGVSRSGYTGEDGFELTVPTAAAVALAETLLAEPEVALAGLAARDSLRLEAGLCLYGHDLDSATTPVEAGLAWTIQKSRREGGGFPGDGVILRQLTEGPARHRVGLRPDGRKPVREGAPLRPATVIPGDPGPGLAGDPAGGVVTSGGFGPTYGGPLAMGYVSAGLHTVGTTVVADVRGTDVTCTVVDLPFVPHRYHRKVPA
jgi:aminomethyltransferase